MEVGGGGSKAIGGENLGGASSTTGGGGRSTGVGGDNWGGASGTGGSNSGGTSGAGGGARAGFPPSKSYLCNLVTGDSVTHDWFTSGFGAGLDKSRWEALAPAQAGKAFIQFWADPNSALWSMTKLTPCTQGADNPDRIIFKGVNWQYTTAAEWVTQYEAVLKVIQSKFPGVKEIDLATMLRAPGNTSCGSAETVVQPFIDEAIQTIVAKYPKLVRAAPKVYAPSCNVFSGGGPHFTPAGVQVVAQLYSDVFAAEP